LSKRFSVLLEKGETQMKVLAPYRIAIPLRGFFEFCLSWSLSTKRSSPCVRRECLSKQRCPR
jgi:hypothetical protein